MLAQECVRKLMLRCGSRFGASRSASRTTPPRLGGWARAGWAANAAATRATKAMVRRRTMTDPPLRKRRVSALTEKERNGPERVPHYPQPARLVNVRRAPRPSPRTPSEGKGLGYDEAEIKAPEA